VPFHSQNLTKPPRTSKNPSKNTPLAPQDQNKNQKKNTVIESLSGTFRRAPQKALFDPFCPFSTLFTCFWGLFDRFGPPPGLDPLFDPFWTFSSPLLGTSRQKTAVLEPKPPGTLQKAPQNPLFLTFDLGPPKIDTFRRTNTFSHFSTHLTPFRTLLLAGVAFQKRRRLAYFPREDPPERDPSNPHVYDICDKSVTTPKCAHFGDMFKTPLFPARISQ